jgi:uncharacterized protein (DUF1330 family)
MPTKKKYVITLVNVTTIEIEADYLDQASSLALTLKGDKLLDHASEIKENETGWRPIKIGGITLLHDGEIPIDPTW